MHKNKSLSKDYLNLWWHKNLKTRIPHNYFINFWTVKDYFKSCVAGALTCSKTTNRYKIKNTQEKALTIELESENQCKISRVWTVIDYILIDGSSFTKDWELRRSIYNTPLSSENQREPKQECGKYYTQLTVSSPISLHKQSNPIQDITHSNPQQQMNIKK